MCVKGDHDLVRFWCLRLLRSSRSANTGPRVYWEMPLNNTFADKDVTYADMLEAINEEGPEGIDGNHPLSITTK